MTRVLLAACALVAAAASLAEAQTRPAPQSRPPVRRASTPRIEVGGGGGLAGGLSLGSRDAELLSGSTPSSPFRLFASDTQLDSSALFEARLGYRLNPRITIEGTFGFARPPLTTSLSGDSENAASVDATGTVTEYVIDGGAIWRLSTNARRRWRPFVSGGAGVARHVHEGLTLIESGVDSYVGGGVLSRLGVRTGLRFDGRVHFLSGGLAAGQGLSPRGVVTGSIFVLF